VSLTDTIRYIILKLNCMIKCDKGDGFTKRWTWHECYRITKCVASRFIQTSSINCELPIANKCKQLSDQCSRWAAVLLPIDGDDLASSVINNIQRNIQHMISFQRLILLPIACENPAFPTITWQVVLVNKANGNQATT